MKTATANFQLFRRRNLRMRIPLAGAAVFLAGAVAVFLGHMGGVVAIAAGLALIGAGVAAGRKAIVSVDSYGVLLRFKRDVNVAFASISKVGLVKGTGIELTLHAGGTVMIPLAQLEDSDGEWLRKELRNAVSQRRERAPAPAGSSPYSIS